jgi:peptide/nickel transport system substrate-binding protein
LAERFACSRSDARSSRRSHCRTIAKTGRYPGVCGRCRTSQLRLPRQLFFCLHPPGDPALFDIAQIQHRQLPEIIGDLAESWTVSADKRTYIFKLRQNVLFHDGSPLSSADVKASYERIIHPPQGVLSVRQADYAAVTSIDTPDPATLVFHLQWPDAAMLANFASPWNCIYRRQSSKMMHCSQRLMYLAADRCLRRTREGGDHWTGKRWDRYFLPGKPYLDGYRAEFVAGAAAVKGIESGRLMAQFRSFSPAERDEMVSAAGESIEVRESPWISYLALAFNATSPPFDDPRVRRALSLAIDRWQGAQTLADGTFLKYVGGLMRPGTGISVPEAELVKLPDFSRDITASRAEARRLLAEAGVPDLVVTLTNRKDVPIPTAQQAICWPLPGTKSACRLGKKC